MTNQTGKVTNGSIKLPPDLQSAWENASVYISGERDIISIKRLSSPELSTMLDEMNDIGKNISKDDVQDVLKAARNKNK